jgi:capsular polysaccharide biosynthesis protein
VRLARHRPGTALLLGAANSDNYYHWVMESLPRWHLLQLAGWQNYDYVLLLNQPRAFQNELLDRLGVSAAKRLHCSKNFIHQFDRLVVPAMPAPPWQARAWACAWLRSLFPQTGGGGPEKIYLSRRDVQRRRLVNEPEIAAQLASRGFVSVQLEQLTVAAQAKLFANARCVVAPHGAGLANLVFAAPGTRVVELFHPDVLTPCYQNLAVAGGLQYAAITGTRVRARSRHDEQAEFSIEIPALLQTLAEENLLSK